jgi:hypothetical protein
MVVKSFHQKPYKCEGTGNTRKALSFIIILTSFRMSHCRTLQGCHVSVHYIFWAAYGFVCDRYGTLQSAGPFILHTVPCRQTWQIVYYFRDLATGVLRLSSSNMTCKILYIHLPVWRKSITQKSRHESMSPLQLFWRAVNILMCAENRDTTI